MSAEYLRLFMEMRQQAMGSIVATGRDEFRADELKWTATRHPWGQLEIRLDFKLNGKPCHCVRKLERQQFQARKGGELSLFLNEKITEMVQQMVADHFTVALFEVIGGEVASFIDDK